MTMWHNPRMLNVTAGALTAAALLLLGFAGLHALLRSSLFPLREIVIEGALVHAGRDALLGVTRERAHGNFFSVDLSAIRSGLQSVPWVRAVSVRRVWPDRLKVSIEEHVALARWNDDALVNVQGEVFAGQSEEPLPLLVGPAGTEADVAQRYRRFVEILAPLKAAPVRVVLTPRYAWQIELDSGLRITLGRDVGAHPAEARLVRFVAVYPETLARLAQAHGDVDLRYPNGFALRVPGLPTAPAAGAARS